jgi:hypothetical protein
MAKGLHSRVRVKERRRIWRDAMLGNRVTGEGLVAPLYCTNTRPRQLSPEATCRRYGDGVSLPTFPNIPPTYTDSRQGRSVLSINDHINRPGHRVHQEQAFEEPRDCMCRLSAGQACKRVKVSFPTTVIVGGWQGLHGVSSDRVSDTYESPFLGRDFR